MSWFNSIKFYLKSIIFGSVVGGCAIYGIIASILLRLVNKLQYAQYSVARSFYHIFGALVGLKIRMINEHYLKDLPAVCISNHQSALDIYILGRIFQPGYTVTSKASLKFVPLMGWFMMLSGTFFLDRSKGAKAKKVLESALSDLKRDKKALFMFPEGTRSASMDLEMLPFKKGAFYLARDAGIPIIPVVVSNTSTIFNSKFKIFNRGEITIEVLPPVSTAGIETNEDVTNLVNKVREDMVDTLKRIGYSRVGPELEVDTESIQSSSSSSSSVEIEPVTQGTLIVEAD
ncbi:putative 1-acyl-sn-glycerol-3-phosphate acyltransferase [Spathaspora sp. JA1]|nr:putative 1-acyl-sn-glycerol-3-phosphate acyltransferase [Spathaspora sp. JA1]